MEKKGIISVQSENIFPIIKKFLYSDCDVFLRELVSNAVDASQKLKQLSLIGKYTGPVDELKISITADEEHKTITISDMGIGMDADEIEKYINQVAFSGATDFVNKYQTQIGNKSQLIGFFGLGFYSAFMVSDKVEIITKSYKDNSESIIWTCDGSTSFEIKSTDKPSIGTDVILHINNESEEYLKKYKISNLLDRYCKFLPIPIWFDGKQINNTEPIWIRHPQNLNDEDYKSFYKELYPYSPEPLFWLHLNIDYPFNLTGILYFPAGLQNIEFKQEKIQLYSHQVFITDELDGVVPTFLTLLHGVIDSPDIPLNVSRSSLQADRNVKSINSHIIKKFADKLIEIFKNDRNKFEGLWEKIEIVVKYGAITDLKFLDQIKDFILLKNINGDFLTIQELIDKIKDNQTDKDGKIVVLYATDVNTQDIFIQACKNAGYDIVLMGNQLDAHLLAILESKFTSIVFKGVNSDSVKNLISKNITETSMESNKDEQDKLKEIFADAVGDLHIHWSVESLSEDDMPVTVTVSENANRLHQMEYWQKGEIDDIVDEYSAIINTTSPKIKDLLKINDKVSQHANAKMLYNLSLIAQDKLKGKELTNFVHSMLSKI